MALGTYDTQRKQEQEISPDSLVDVVKSLLATIPKTKEHLAAIIAFLLIVPTAKVVEPTFAALSADNAANFQEVAASDKLSQIHALVKSLPADTVPTIVKNSEDGETVYFIELNVPNSGRYSIVVGQSELDELSAMIAKSSEGFDFKQVIDSLMRNAMRPPAH